MTDLKYLNSIVVPALARVGIVLSSEEWEQETMGYGEYYSRKADWQGMPVVVEAFIPPHARSRVFRVYTAEYLDPVNSGRFIYHFGARGELTSFSIALTTINANYYGR